MGGGRGVQMYPQMYPQQCLQPNLRERNEHNLDYSPTLILPLPEQGTAATI